MLNPESSSKSGRPSPAKACRALGRDLLDRQRLDLNQLHGHLLHLDAPWRQVVLRSGELAHVYP